MGHLEHTESKAKDENLYVFEEVRADDMLGLNLLSVIDINRSSNERIWVDFIECADKEVEVFNGILEPSGIKVTATWDEDEEGLEWIEFCFRMLDENNSYSYCFLDVRNYGNEHFQFNRTSVTTDLDIMLSTLKERFYSGKIRELYEGIVRVHQ